MKSGKSVISAFALSAVISSSTPVQAATDRQISEGMLDDYVACMFGHTPHRIVEKFLRIDPNSNDAIQAGSRLLSDLLRDEQIRCVPTADMRFQPGVARGAIYEFLYKDRVAHNGKALPLAMPIEDHRSELTILGPDNGQAFSDLRAYGDCVVRAGPDKAQRLILAGPDTPEEAASFASMGDSFGGCLASGSVRFSREALRGIIAEALYKFTV